jgi:hypothetical protein
MGIGSGLNIKHFDGRPVGRWGHLAGMARPLRIEVAGGWHHADGSGVTQALKRLEARVARNRSLAKKLEQPTKPSRVNGRPRFPHQFIRPRNCRARSPEGYRLRAPARAVPVILSFPLRRHKLTA